MGRRPEAGARKRSRAAERESPGRARRGTSHLAEPLRAASLPGGRPARANLARADLARADLARADLAQAKRPKAKLAPSTRQGPPPANEADRAAGCRSPSSSRDARRAPPSGRRTPPWSPRRGRRNRASPDPAPSRAARRRTARMRAVGRCGAGPPGPRDAERPAPRRADARRRSPPRRARAGRGAPASARRPRADRPPGRSAPGGRPRSR
ncbi:pentapeptide repeat-containing protein [Methylobacterium tarhaniae]|uniref:pentapeptide repeat-containing protein n=1 Tax=Methylobacterium tarhaniae TaxID=1187852 RepID=UPI003D07554A